MPIRPRSGRSRVVRHRKIVLQFRRAGVPVAEHLAALRIDPGHHVPDCAVFPRSIHRLKYQKQGIAIGRI